MSSKKQYAPLVKTSGLPLPNQYDINKDFLSKCADLRSDNISKSFQNTLFIFRRDLRFQDNTALHWTFQNSKTVFPCFFFTQTQINDDKNPYKSSNAVQIMCETIAEMCDVAPIHLFLTPNLVDSLKDIIQHNHIDCVSFNIDYTPYSVNRDYDIIRLCEELKIACVPHEDALVLNSILSVLKNDGGNYLVFTPFYNKANTIPVRKQLPGPSNEDLKKIHKKAVAVSDSPATKSITPEYFHHFYTHNPSILHNGGRAQAMKRIENLKHMKSYDSTRNDPNKETSHLSPYLKFGVVSPREAYHEMKKHGLDGMIRELFWREFYLQILFHNPHIIGAPLKKEYESIQWDYNAKWLDAFFQGKTGFPLVDAGIREMLTTGFMHNRARMAVAMFLTKDMAHDWRIGEQFFAKHLYDYDVANNNGGWQWSSGVGADAAPYFRVFNPTLQLQRFDPKCEYVKKWIPELRDVDAKDILQWEISHKKIKSEYPAPILDHKERVKHVIALFKKA